jgi:hypothetical protein
MENYIRLDKTNERKEGELSPEEAALAKKSFVAFAFLLIAVSIVAAEYFIAIEYVLVLILAFGMIGVLLLSKRASSARS